MTVTPELEEPLPVSDPPEFAAWVAARGPALQRFAYLVTGRRDDAPDLVQDALSRAYPRWDRLAVTDTAEAYVRRSIVNASITGWRKDRHLVAVEDPEPHVRPHDHHADPTARLDDADEAWALVRTLPTQQRAAVVLRFYEDQSFAQIAVVLDCAEATARSHVHRAVAALRTRLFQQPQEDTDD